VASTARYASKGFVGFSARSDGEAFIGKRHAPHRTAERTDGATLPVRWGERRKTHGTGQTPAPGSPWHAASGRCFPPTAWAGTASPARRARPTRVNFQQRNGKRHSTLPKRLNTRTLFRALAPEFGNQKARQFRGRCAPIFLLITMP
jgi:hypothetical protein